ncbi:MAG TPA: amidoligase family protein [Tepidisphaeraceae bacterium]|jgi:hypothetical protein
MEPPLPFHLPPVIHNASGETRKAGFELEYTGVSIAHSAQLVRDVFGGDHQVDSTFEHQIHTPAGKFQCEIDTSFLKDKRYEKALETFGIELEDDNRQKLESMLLGVASTVVPIEIGTPPIPITELAPLDELTRRLRRAGAKGTRASLLYAFGMHINPEIPTDDPAVLRDFLRAFVLLYPWLKNQSEVDVSRSISPYIKAFPNEYVRLILQPDYPASRARLIDDYIAHNATRNRPLDMLPVLAFLDKQRVMDRVEDPHLVKPRGAFHYRLPNCMVDEPQWTLAEEWNRWVAVERLAYDPERMAEMSREYERAEEQSFRPFYEKWPNVLEQYMRA